MGSHNAAERPYGTGLGSCQVVEEWQTPETPMGSNGLRNQHMPSSLYS